LFWWGGGGKLLVPALLLEDMEEELETIPRWLVEDMEEEFEGIPPRWVPVALESVLSLPLFCCRNLSAKPRGPIFVRSLDVGLLLFWTPEKPEKSKARGDFGD
jgi:hypothetical protein